MRSDASNAQYVGSFCSQKQLVARNANRRFDFLFLRISRGLQELGHSNSMVLKGDKSVIGTCCPFSPGDKSGCYSREQQIAKHGQAIRSHGGRHTRHGLIGSSTAQWDKNWPMTCSETTANPPKSNSKAHQFGIRPTSYNSYRGNRSSTLCR